MELVKGAPDVVLARCSQAGGPLERFAGTDRGGRSRYPGRERADGREGLRVLAFGARLLLPVPGLGRLPLRAGRVCANKPVRADYLDTVVWDHITGLLANPQLIRTEIDKRLDTARHTTLPSVSGSGCRPLSPRPAPPSRA